MGDDDTLFPSEAAAPAPAPGEEVPAPAPASGDEAAAPAPAPGEEAAEKPATRRRRKPKEPEPKFEEALAQLEKIVEEMESGQLSLEDSLQRFEDGTRLAHFCNGKLKETEKRVEVLLRNAESETWVPYEEEH